MKIKKICSIATACLIACLPLTLTACQNTEDGVLTLRVANWEEYIDLGGEEIELENPYTGEETIYSENAIYEDFEIWYEETYGKQVKIEYSTFGTNEDLYNRMNLGDVYDLVCPSEYLIMKLKNEDKLVPYSQNFFDTSVEHNYYITGVSKYIEDRLTEIDIDKYAACYMLGTTGMVYNPELIEDESDVYSWDIFTNEAYTKQVTIKDNVRDAYFATLGDLYTEELIAINNNSSLSTQEKAKQRSEIMNNTDEQTIARAEDKLKEIKNNVYSFETDSGKDDMITGKVIANFQWSGDAVFIMDEAENDDIELWYAVPEAVSNLWFDGWVMLKSGINNNPERQAAAEAFVNFLSRPDNAVRNMYYIGYTSSIADSSAQSPDENLIYQYLDYCYGFCFGEEEAESLYLYDVNYFFSADEGYELYVDASIFNSKDTIYLETIEEDGVSYKVYTDGTLLSGRQLFAQYPTESIIDRCVVMLDFGDRLTKLNQMWINVRCPDVKDFNPVSVAIVFSIVGITAAGVCLYIFKDTIFRHVPKKGYKKVN